MWIREKRIEAADVAKGRSHVTELLQAAGFVLDEKHGSGLAHPWKEVFDDTGSTFYQGATS